MTVLRLIPALAAASMLAALTVGPVEAQPQPGGGPQQQNLPALLHLRPEQMASFRNMEAASQPNPDEISRLRAASPQALSALTTPQRLDRFGASLAVRQELFRRGADATRAFYNQLSPDQQRTFDQLSAPSAGQGRGRPQ